MPAVQLARLRLQAAHLCDSFTRPTTFVRGLHALLDSYADRTQRPGQAGEPKPLISAYHVPVPVLGLIMMELHPHISKDPQSAIHLCELLWEQEYLECRTLAANILGSLPAGYEEPTWVCVVTWAKKENDPRLLSLLLDLALVGIRRRSAHILINHVEVWLHGENLHEQRLALLALRPLVQESSIETLPALFRLLTRLVRTTPMALRKDLLLVLREMARHSPTETAYFLRQTLDSPLSLDTPKIIRQLLPDFPADTRIGLREALRNVGR